MPLTLVKCIPIGVILMMDNGAMDEKIIAIAEKDPMWNSYTDINELPPHYIREVSNFFEVYKLLEDGVTAVNGSLNKEGAIKIIDEAIIRYQEHFKK